VTIRVASGSNAAENTGAAWPVSSTSFDPVPVSKTWTDCSSVHVTMKAPFRLTSKPASSSILRSISAAFFLPAASQIRTFLSDA
jgi:hypothetical protein